MRRSPARPTASSGAPVRSLVTAIMLVAAGAATLAFPWTRNMYTGPVVLPQVESRVPVEDTIAVDGERLRDRIESRDLPNPVPHTPEALAEGEWLYGTYCALCHGATGQQVAQSPPVRY